MNLDQLTYEDRRLLEQAARRATTRGAAALARLVQGAVEVGRSRLDVEAIADTHRLIDSLPSHVGVVYVEVAGDLAGQLVMVCPAASATALVHTLVTDPGEFGIDRSRIRQDVLGEIGNIVLSTWLASLSDETTLDANLSTPLVAAAATDAVMELPLARAASQQDVVVRIDTSFRLDGPGEDPIHMPFHVLFLPAPGVLNRVVELLGARRIGEHRLPVRMGELVVSRRPGDVLVASALGSCVAIALVDRLAGVATMAHVMLPESPDSSPGSLRGVPLFSARYANLAVPSLILALEQAGGRRVCCQAYLAGGGQMFTGSLAEAMDVPQRNLAAARAALAMHGIAIRGEETGGALSRSMEVDVASGSVTVKNTGRDVRRLDQAA